MAVCNGQDPEQQRTLVASLFAQPRSIVVNNIGSCIVASACWRYSGHVGYLWWGIAFLAVMSCRLGVASAFHREPDRLRPDGWAQFFLVGAVATASVMGLGLSAAVLLDDDAVAQLFMACNVISFVGGAAVRNSASPLAARSQTILALGGPGLACLVSGKPYLEVFSLLILLHLSAQFEIIRALGRQTSWLISAEREQALANVRLSRACKELEGANARLLELSLTDALTGLSNRRVFDSVLNAQWARAGQNALPLALLMIDADCFKRFNDRHGHVAGDCALRSIADVVSNAQEQPDGCSARLGGEEFAVLLPGADLAIALVAAEAIRHSVSVAPIHGLPDEHVTVSIGVASLTPRLERDSRELLLAADEALYRGKANGRNRIEGARTTTHFLTGESSRAV